MNDENKLIIYQVFTRLFGNNNNHCINNGSITENGCGKMADFTAKALGEIKKLGATHIWYTGIIEHATQTDYPMPSRTTMMSIRISPRTYRSV